MIIATKYIILKDLNQKFQKTFHSSQIECNYIENLKYEICGKAPGQILMQCFNI